MTEATLTKNSKKRGRHKIGRVTTTLRLFPSTKRLLRKAAGKRQLSDYAEELFLRDFKARGLLEE